MNDTAIAIIFVVMLIGALAGVAYLLDRRAKAKGDILTGSRRPPYPRARVRFYLSMLATLVGVALGVWGVLRLSIPVIVIGGLLFVTSIGARYYWQLRHLARSEKDEGRPGDSG